MKVWIASNVPDWRLEECDLPITESAITVNQWMNLSDSSNPSVIRWMSESVTGVWPIEGSQITAQWKSLGDEIGEVCTGNNDVLETIVCIYTGNCPDRERNHWIELTGGKVELPSQRPLIVLTHRAAVRDGQHRVDSGANGASIGLALAYAAGFLRRNEMGN